jgi:quercetin dioxygenase-like cupin family protein
MTEPGSDAGPKLTRWAESPPPSEEMVDGLLRSEGLRPSWWSNGPGDRYGSHSHPYHKVLYCARGSIRFTNGRTGEHYDLTAGDRLDLPPGTPHSAVVGAEGVTCVEAARA